jgi:hypothetical protein
MKFMILKRMKFEQPKNKLLAWGWYGISNSIALYQELILLDV